MPASKKLPALTSSNLDDTICKQMTNLVELLVTSGKSVLVPEVMKKFKKLCRTSDDYVRYAYDLLMIELVQDHSEVRLTAFQMIDELFNRSHAFREKVLDGFQTLLELTLDCEHNCPLPPPQKAASRLKDEAIDCIQQWYEKFGEAYKKLSLGYQYLRSCKKVDFDAVIARRETERRQREETERKLEEARLMKLEQVGNEMTDMCPDIELCLKEIENCIQLLVPHPDMFFIPEPETPELQTKLLMNQTGSENGSSDCRTKLKDDGADQVETNVRQSLDQQKCDKCLSNQACTVESLRNRKATQNSESSENAIDVPVLTDKGKTACSCDGSVKIREDTVKINDTVDVYEGNKETTKMSETGSSSKDIDINSERYSSELVERIQQDNSTIIARTSEKESSENDTDDEDDDDFENVEFHAGFTQNYGLGSRNYEISVTVGGEDRLRETEDNKYIIQSLRDQYRLVKTKYLATIKRWLQIMESNHAGEEKLKTAGDMKTRLEDALKKCVELEILGNTEKEDGGSESDDDFEEVVDKEGYEEDVPEHVKLTDALEKPSTSKQSGSKSKSKSRTKPSVDSKSKNKSSERLKLIASKAIASQQKTCPKELASGSDAKQETSLKSFKADNALNSESSNTQQRTSLKKSASATTSSSASGQKTSLVKSASVTSPCSKGKTTPSYWSLNCRLQEEDVRDPTTWKSNMAKLMEKAQAKSSVPDVTIKKEPDLESLEPDTDNSIKKDLLEKAPVVPFGMDLEHWENPDKIEVPLQVKYDGASRFWVTNEEGEKDNKKKVAALTMRTMSFTGEFEPVKWKCRAPLPSGKLCERMDREKCPFHGKIIARDETGQPTDPADIARLMKLETVNNTEMANMSEVSEESEDTEQNLDLDLAGVSWYQSKSKAKGKRKRKRKGKGKSSMLEYPGLTDTTRATSTSRDRLEAKIFKRSTMKRVNADLDRADFKRVRDKFGSQFNYSLH